jgi:hypothetical protein
MKNFQEVDVTFLIFFFQSSVLWAATRFESTSYYFGIWRESGCGSANRHTHYNYLLRNCTRAPPRASTTNHTSTLSLYYERLIISPSSINFLKISAPIPNTTRRAQSSRALDDHVSETSSCLRVHTRVLAKLEGRMAHLSFISLFLLPTISVRNSELYLSTLSSPSGLETDQRVTESTFQH